MYDANLRIAEVETKTFVPTTISAIDLLIVFARQSSGASYSKKTRLKALNSLFTAHLIGSYLAGRPPRYYASLELIMTALNEIPVALIEKSMVKNRDVNFKCFGELSLGSSVVFLLHGRDGLAVASKSWTEFDRRWSHLDITLLISENIRRVATKVLTGWVDGTPDPGFGAPSVSSES